MAQLPGAFAQGNRLQSCKLPLLFSVLVIIIIVVVVVVVVVAQDHSSGG